MTVIGSSRVAVVEILNQLGCIRVIVEEGCSNLFSADSHAASSDDIVLIFRLQTARFLIKALLAAREGTSPTASAAYVGDTSAEARRRCRVKDAAQWLDSDVQLDALR